MTTATTVRSWPAIGFGVFFAIVTAYVLFEDVIAGAPITTSHVLTLAALVAAIASAHYAWPSLRQAFIVPAILMAVLFVASNGYILVSSTARNAETAGAKSALIADNNAARARELQQLARAEGMLAEAERKLDKDCVKGKASKGTCDGIRATVAVYAAAIKGHKATMKELGPALSPSAGFAHAARTIAALPFVSATAEAIEDQLVQIMPFLRVLISELGTAAFLQLGLGHRPARSPDHRQPVAPKTVRPGQSRPDDAKPTTGPSDRPATSKPQGGRSGGPKAPAKSRQEAEADLLTLLALGQSVPSQKTLADRWGRPKQTVSDWLKAWEAAGLIEPRRQVGREKSLTAA